MDRLDTFTEVRPLLFSIAYRMLGSVMEAEDIVQEAFLRWQRADLAEVESPKAYLSTIVTRLAIDHLRSAQTQREVYTGPWLPEPLIGESPDPPAEAALLSESLSMAFLVLLESLTPDERAVFLLREVFDYDYAEIARIMDKTEAACRQILSRARQRVSENRPRFDVSPNAHDQVVAQFVQATLTGDLAGLMSVIAPDAVLISDGGGKAAAARRSVHGPDHIARLILGLFRQAPPGIEARLARVNAQPGFIYYRDGIPFYVMSLHIAEGRIQSIHNILNPDKLSRIPPLAP